MQYDELVAIDSLGGLKREVFSLKKGFDFQSEDPNQAVIFVPEKHEAVTIPNGTLLRFKMEQGGNYIFGFEQALLTTRKEIAEFLKKYGNKYFAASPRTVQSNIKSFR